MKRVRIIGVCLLALWLCLLGVCPASAETPADAARTFVYSDGALTSEDGTAAFWEYPQLTAGQTRRDGSLTLINHGIGSVAVELGGVQYPYDDDAALAYLDALRLTIRDGDRVLYDGAFSRLGDEGLTEPVTLGQGETRRLSIDLACDFAYAGDVVCEQVLYWNWQASSSWPSWLQSVLNAWMIWVPALLLIVAAIVWLRVRRARRPNPAVQQPTQPRPDIPLPPTAPRTPVTLQIDPNAKPPKPPKPAKQPKPAKPGAPSHFKPAGRHKAAHAAPRHAKKK